MSKKKKVYSGAIETFPNKEILLNVNRLEEGWYSLKILYKNKVIKQVTFKK
jgi:hypothetical protein